MLERYLDACIHPVALLAEGVDRNRLICWISCEIKRVALLAEGVDRNPEGG